jgi:peptide/nickel transport system substrate-binding protein
MLDEMRSGITIEETRSLFGEIKDLSKEELPYYCLLYKTYGAIKAPALQGDVMPLFSDFYYGCEKWKCRYEVTEEKSSEQ